MYSFTSGLPETQLHTGRVKAGIQYYTLCDFVPCNKSHAINRVVDLRFVGYHYSMCGISCQISKIVL